MTTPAALDRSQASATSSPAPVSEAPASTETSGFDQDGLLDSLGTCDPAAKEAGVVATDLRGGFVTSVGKLIDASAPVPGSEAAIDVALRIPLEACGVAGKLNIKASRDAKGKLTGSLGGALGPSAGDGLTWSVDLLAGVTLEGEGASGARVVEMMVFALETHIRSLPDQTLNAFVNPRLGTNFVIVPLLAWYFDYDTPDALADLIWGKGHAKDVAAAMQAGEAAQITGALTLAGSSKPNATAGPAPAGAESSPELALEGSVGVAVQQRTEKTGEAPATTTTSEKFSMAGSLALSPITGGFGFEMPLDNPQAGKLTFTGSAKVTPAQVASLALFADFVVQSIGSIGSALANVDNEHAAAVAEAATRLATLAGAIHGDITAMSSAVTAALGGESQLEVSAELDFGAKQCKIQFATINEVGGELGKVVEGKASQKLLVGNAIEVPL